MNDFLKNLRTPQRTPHSRHATPPRKTVEGQNLAINERRKILDRRSALPQGLGTGLLLESLNDAMPALTENIAQIASCLERMVDTQERLADSEREKNVAVRDILKNLNLILTEKLLPILATVPEQRPGDSSVNHYQNEPHHAKEDVINTIRSMRNNRSTFAEIADYLKSKGIPTFSGRGEWHAQTIHRLCK